MIAINRIRDDDLITHKLKGVELEKILKALLVKRIRHEQDNTIKFKVISKWKPAKEQLIIESNGKCAFCECEIPSHSNGDVEHYRPKSIYWWLAYAIDNFLLSCSICNQRKLNHFDVRNVRVSCGNLPDETDVQGIDNFIKQFARNPARANTNNSIIGLKKLRSKEKPKLLNPYLEDKIEDYFIWSFDDVLKEVEMSPKPSLSKQKKENATYTIKLLDLNRIRLKKRRYKELLKLRKTIELGATFGMIQPLYLLPDCEYAGMNKFYCKEVGLETN